MCGHQGGFRNGPELLYSAVMVQGWTCVDADTYRGKRKSRDPSEGWRRERADCSSCFFFFYWFVGSFIYSTLNKYCLSICYILGYCARQ